MKERPIVFIDSVQPLSEEEEQIVSDIIDKAWEEEFGDGDEQ